MNIINYQFDKLAIAGRNINKVMDYSLYDYLNEMCLINGSSLQGRIDSFNYIVKSKQKTPILISIKHKLLLIPLYSIYSKECILLNYYNIYKISKKDEQTYIYFIDGNMEVINIDIRIIRNQIKRVKRYLEHLYDRLESHTYDSLDII